MIGQGIFSQGTTVMPSEAVCDDLHVATGWTDCTVNAILLVVITLLCIINLRSYITLLPYMRDCMYRWRVNSYIESDLPVKHCRNFSFYTLFLLLSLMAARYDILGLDYMHTLKAEFQSLFCFAVMAGYLLVRRLGYGLCNTRYKHHDTVRLANSAGMNYLVCTWSAGLLAICICHIIGTSGFLMNTICLAAMGLIWIIGVIHICQILRSACSPFQTFLYLCALEFLPAAALAAVSLLI